MAPSRKPTPLRAAITDHSHLREKIQKGIGAVKASDHGYFAGDVRVAFGDSLDIDQAFRSGHDQENRWDYLLGHSASSELVAVEPHSARQDQISTVIKKKNAATNHLRPHLKAGARISKWLWVSSGRVHFADTERTRLLLDQNGIEFAGSIVLLKHMPSSTASRKGRRK